MTRASALLLCLGLLGSAARADQAEQLFADANSAFLSGDQARATAAWQALVDEGVASAELETNLGASLLRQGHRGLSALHLERALYLRPGDEDARADLQELRKSNVDRLEGEEEGGGESLYRALAPLPGTAAVVLLLVGWLLGWGALGLRLFSPVAARLPLVPAQWVGFGLALLGGLGTGAAAAAHQLALRRAVVVAAASPAREGPQERAASHFEVHEGTLVRVEDSENGFFRIKLQNGLTGWVRSDGVELVVPPAWGGLKLR